LAYVPPQLRVQRNTLRVQEQIDALLSQARLLAASRDLAEINLDNELHSASVEASKHTGPRMPTHTLPFCLLKKELDYLRGNFPRTTFKCSKDTRHDHPVGHTENMIGTGHALKMAPQGSMIFDMWGSPKDVRNFRRDQANANNPKEIVAIVSLVTPRDHIRKLSWPAEFDNNGVRVYAESCGDLVTDVYGAVTDAQLSELVYERPIVYFFRQSFYYISDVDMARLLRVRGSRAIAVVHRHMNEEGSLFNGEITYAKKVGAVEQVNALSGERYYHRDVSFLWDSKSKTIHTGSGSFAWTMHMVTAETWIIVFTGVPTSVEPRVEKAARSGLLREEAARVNEHDLTPTDFPHPCLATLPSATCRMVGGIPFVTVGAVDMPPVKLTSPELYEFLQLSVVGKPRDSNRLSDMFALARTHVAGGSDFPGKMNFKCSAADLAGHVCLAFVSGLPREIDLLRAIACYHVAIREHSALLDGAALVVSASVPAEGTLKSGVAMMKRIDAARKRGDLFDAAISMLD